MNRKSVSTWSVQYKAPYFRDMQEGVDYIFTDAQMSDALVDIPMLTYNHAAHIAQAIESVLCQKTQFRYRLLIADDCSTDGTSDIVREYQAKYPDRIATIMWKHNVGAKCNGLITARHATAKYLAPLEGEDFLIDERKIEKSISFLETHPEFIAFAHNIMFVDDNGKMIHGYDPDYPTYPFREEHVCPRDNVKNFHIVWAFMPSQVNAVVLRNIERDWSEERWDTLAKCTDNGDSIRMLDLNHLGDIYFSRDVMMAFRRSFTKDGLARFMLEENRGLQRYRQRLSLNEYSKSVHGVELACLDKMLEGYDTSSTWKALMHFNAENLRVLLAVRALQFGRKLRKMGEGK